MKVAVSIPTRLFERADQAAGQLGLNRSQLYARAIDELLQRLGTDPVTSRLDELGDEYGPSIGSASARQLIDSGAWQW